MKAILTLRIDPIFGYPVVSKIVKVSDENA
jgi:hypothetical protein